MGSSRFGILIGVAVIAACGTLSREPGVPPPLSNVSLDGLGSLTIRYSPFEDRDAIVQDVTRAYAQEAPDNYDLGPGGEHIYNYLAVSGGGSDGAFGAGLLNGWSESGTRPRFKIVTGVSTGALIAPFAFLGPDYDDELKTAYTTIDADRIFLAHGLLPMLWSESMASTKPLEQLISSNIDDKILAAVAAEHRKGRRLYVATTNLDAEQPIMWNMGAIADSRSPDRLALFRKVLLASASIPSIFSPVLINVTTPEGKRQEMHVDGGVFFQSFFVASMVDLPEIVKAAHPDFTGDVQQNLYVLRNSWVTPVYQEVPRGLTGISMRAILMMFKISGINDLWRLYLSSRDDDITFRYTAIPADYVPSTTKQFDRAEMNRLYEYGHGMAMKGISWFETPPGYAAPEDLAVP
jgi:hypothetical protein